MTIGVGVRKEVVVGGWVVSSPSAVTNSTANHSILLQRVENQDQYRSMVNMPIKRKYNPVHHVYYMLRVELVQLVELLRDQAKAGNGLNRCNH